MIAATITTEIRLDEKYGGGSGGQPLRMLRVKASGLRTHNGGSGRCSLTVILAEKNSLEDDARFIAWVVTYLEGKLAACDYLEDLELYTESDSNA